MKLVDVIENQEANDCFFDYLDEEVKEFSHWKEE
jgi:hypothetical protein